MNGTATSGFLVQARELKVMEPEPLQKGGPAAPGDAISVHIPPGELVILAGGNRASGDGQTMRSLLLKTLAGLRPPAGGDLLLDGVKLYPYRKLFAGYIGYVPARLALPETLTVLETLRYAARLRMPRGTHKNLRSQRVSDLLEVLGLQGMEGARLSRLDGLHRRLVSVAVELVNAPRLLLIEEPAESLNPADEVRLVRLLKQLRGSFGPTILLSADATRCAQLADKLIVLTSQGEMAWFGPGDEGLAYFRSLTSRERVPGPFALEDAQETLATQSPVNGETWFKGYQALPAYSTYIDDPLNDRHPDLQLEARPLSRFRGAAKEKTPPPPIRQVSGFTKFNLFAGRAIRQWTRERSGLALLLAPPLVALVDFALSSPNMNDPNLGDPAHAPIAIGVVIFLAMLVAALLFAGQMVKERTVIQRERRSQALALPYALSKAWLVLLLAVYQGLVWAAVHVLAIGVTTNLVWLPATWITLALVTLVGGLLGLVASSLARSRAGAAILAVALILPQLLLSGSILPLYQLPGPAQAVSAANPARYAFESLLTLSGYGANVAADACWQMPLSKRKTLTPDQKQNCGCTGENLITMCSFPGINRFFTELIEQPMPSMPSPDRALPNLPPQPVLAQGETFEQYANAVNDYTNQVSQSLGRTDPYTGFLQQYRADLETWLGSRQEQIGNAEGLIALSVDQYGSAFQANLIQDWQILIAMSFVAVLLVIAMTVVGLQANQPRAG